MYIGNVFKYVKTVTKFDLIMQKHFQMETYPNTQKPMLSPSIVIRFVNKYFSVDW